MLAITIRKVISNLRRLVSSIVFVSASDWTTTLAFRIISLINFLIRLQHFLPNHVKTVITVRWFLHDCVVAVKFLGANYTFHCPKSYDFNVHVNPFIHEYKIASLVSRLLQDGDNFLDVGSYGGLYTLIASIKVGEKGRVISIEPNPESVKFLKLNIQLNRIENTIVVPKAVGDVEKTTVLSYSPLYRAFTSLLRKENKSFKVNMTTLDSIYMQHLTPDAVKMIKIDTEGYDLHVLKGAKHVLSKTRYLVVEKNTNEVIRFLTNHSFEVDQSRAAPYLFAVKKPCSRTSKLAPM